ncbi:MAG: NrfD/PsrC family molybdoenzyme membrane anchor subunit [Alphaproteobacteria bacterium]
MKITAETTRRLIVVVLSLLIVVGAVAWWGQLDRGLAVTGLTDQVSWGLYIGNFVYLVGVAAAAVVLVVPAYVFRVKEIEEVVVLGEYMAIAAVMMAMLFILADLGQPARIWHTLPLIGRLNFPASVLAWDIVVLTGYLLLNISAVGYRWRCERAGRAPAPGPYFALMMTAIVLGLSIHTITAFMLAGNPARPFWHSAALAPRFIASAFASGAALMILALQAKGGVIGGREGGSARRLLGLILLFSLVIDLFLMGSEAFVQLYRPTASSPAARLAMGGIHGLSVAALVVAAGITLVHRLRDNPRWLIFASALVIPAVWYEKGLGLIVPGFRPTPIGEIASYAPTGTEIAVTLGIWAAGLLLFAVLANGTILSPTKKVSGSRS